MESQGFSPARLELGCQSPHAREEYSCSSSISEQTTHVSTNECRLNKQNLSRDTKCPDLDHNSWLSCGSLDSRVVEKS